MNAAFLVLFPPTPSHHPEASVRVQLPDGPSRTWWVSKGGTAVLYWLDETTREYVCPAANLRVKTGRRGWHDFDTALRKFTGSDGGYVTPAQWNETRLTRRVT